MTEVSVDTLHADVEHLKTDVIDIKQVAKEQAVIIAQQGISNVRLEIYLAQMQTVQNKIDADAKENAKKAEESAKKVEDSQKAMMQIITDIKEEPFHIWKKMNLAVKVAIVTVSTSLLVTYFWGTFQYFMKQGH